MPPSAPLIAGLSLLLFVLAACESETSVLSSQPIVSAVPWGESEEARYRLVEGEEVKASGLLRIERRGEEFVFAQEYEDSEFRNEVKAVADAETLEPRSVDYVIEGPEGERRWQVRYEGGAANIVQRTEDDERSDRLSAPAHSYDSWTDLFLWRTIDFREGFEATYADILSATLARPQVIMQTVKVTGVETVEVPAGSFRAWRVEVRSSEGKQTAWYADEGTRPLVRYDNGSLVFELLSLE